MAAAQRAPSDGGFLLRFWPKWQASETKEAKDLRSMCATGKRLSRNGNLMKEQEMRSAAPSGEEKDFGAEKVGKRYPEQSWAP